jgi:quinol monooxygenase YgiN
MSLLRALCFERPGWVAALCLVGALSVQAQPPAQAAPTGPVYVITHVDIIGGPAGVEQAMKLMHEFQVDSLKDKGAVRFEVMQQDSRFNHFVMSEVWQSREAYDAHNGTDYARRFREKIAPMLGSPFDVRLHKLLP